MTENLRATEPQREIFEEAFRSLSSLDSMYRDDSKAVIAQRRIHKERIEESQSALDRIEENAGKREKELFEHRREIGRTALNLYSNNPEITEDRNRTFALAVQLDQGINMEERDLDNAVRGLLAIDYAVRNNQLILKCLDGQFKSLIVPRPEATGLTLDIQEVQRSSSGLDVSFYVPVETEVEYTLFSREFPSLTKNTREPIRFTSHDGELQGESSYRHTVAATIASDYNVSDVVKRQAKTDTGSGSKQVAYILGRDLIQKAVRSSITPKSAFQPANPEFTYNAWLAGRMVEVDFDCDLSSIREQILQATSLIIDNSAKGYSHSAEPELGSDIANILLEAVHELGAEDELFETFATNLASKSHGQRSIYRDVEVARILFDRIMSRTIQSQ